MRRHRLVCPTYQANLRGSSAARSVQVQAVVGRRPTGQKASVRCASRCALASWVQFLHAHETRRQSSRTPVGQEPCASRSGGQRATRVAVTLPEQHLLWKNASPARTLSGCERDSCNCYRVNIASFDLIGEHPKRQRSRQLSGFVLSLPIDQHARKLGDLSDPSAVIFTFELDR